MSILTPIFLSNAATGVVLACTDASGGTRVPLLGDGDSLVVTNIGYTDGYLAVGNSDVVAVAPGSTASYPVFARTKEDQIVLRKGVDYTSVPYVAGVCATGETTTLIVHFVSR